EHEHGAGRQPLPPNRQRLSEHVMSVAGLNADSDTRGRRRLRHVPNAINLHAHPPRPITTRHEPPLSSAPRKGRPSSPGRPPDQLDVSAVIFTARTNMRSDPSCAGDV